MDAHLFNGEYYHQLIDLTDKGILEELIVADLTVVDGETGRTAARRDWDEYWDAGGGRINYQVGDGCGIDQVAVTDAAPHLPAPHRQRARAQQCTGTRGPYGTGAPRLALNSRYHSERVSVTSIPSAACRISSGVLPPSSG